MPQKRVRPRLFMPFGVTTFLLDVLQAGCVAWPQRPAPAWLSRLRGRAWALIAPVSIVAVVFSIEAASQVADGLAWLALIAVPPLAAVALGRAAHGARPVAALFAIPLLAIAWAAGHTLAGDLAAAAVTALSCVSLGLLLADVTPPLLLK